MPPSRRRRRAPSRSAATPALSTNTFAQATSELQRIEDQGFSYSEISKTGGTRSLGQLRRMLRKDQAPAQRRRRRKYSARVAVDAQPEPEPEPEPQPLASLLHRPSVVERLLEEDKARRQQHQQHQQHQQQPPASSRSSASASTTAASDVLDALEALRGADTLATPQYQQPEMPTLRALDDDTLKRISRMPKPTYEQIELSREWLAEAEERRPSGMYRALDRALERGPLAGDDSGFVPPVHGGLEPLAHRLPSPNSSRPTTAEKGAGELLHRRRTRPTVPPSQQQLPACGPPAGMPPVDLAALRRVSTSQYALTSPEPTATPAGRAAALRGKMKLREQRKALALAFKERLTTLAATERETRRTWRAHGREATRSAEQLVADKYDAELECADIGEAVDELIAQVRMWLPKELLFQYGLHHFLHQRGVQTLHNLISRMQQASRQRSLEHWRWATLQLRAVAHEKAARLLQRVGRGCLGRFEARSRREARQQQADRFATVREKIVEQRMRAATQVQREFRSFLAHRAERQAQRELVACIVLQRAVRVFQSKLLKLVMRSVASSRDAAARVVQRVYRGHLGRRRTRLMRRVRSVEEQRELERLQRIAFMDEFKLHGAAVRIQARWHGREARMYTKRLIAYRRALAARTLQRSFRAYVRRRDAYKTRKGAVLRHRREHDAAVVVQRMFRGYLTKQKFLKLQRQAFRQRLREHAEKQRLIVGPQLVIPTTGAPIVFNYYRMRRAARELKRLVAPFGTERREQAAALTLQRVFRGHRARARFERLVEAKRKRMALAQEQAENVAAASVQRIFKGFKARELRRGALEDIAARVIQRNWRGHLARLVVGELESRENAAIMVQRRWRGSSIRSVFVAKVHERVRLGRSAKKIQAAARRRAAQLLARELRRRRRRAEELSLAFHWSNEQRWAHVRREFVLQSAYDESFKHRHVMQRLFSLWSTGGGDRLESTKFSKMMRESPGLLGNRLTTRTLDIVFAQCKTGKARFLDYNQFIQALDLLADERFGDAPPTFHGFEAREGRLLRMVESHFLESEWAAPVREYLDEAAREHIRLAAVALQRIFRGRAARAFFRHTLMQHVRQQRDQRLHRAASKIQSIFRQRQGRKAMSLRVKQVLRKYVDPSSGEPYWMNPRTGHVTWYKPKLLGDEDVDVAIQPPDQYHAYVVTCAECASNPSTRLCEQCEDPYCTQCFHDLHRIGKKAEHSFLEIQPCPECSYQAATRVCDTCTGERLERAYYCDACYDTFHEDPERKARHVWSAVVTPCTQCGDRASRWRCNQCKDVYCSRCASDSHYRGHRQLHKFTFLAYYPPQAHADYVGALAAKAAAVVAQEEQVKRAAVAEATLEAAALRIQGVWRGYRGYMAGQARIRRARRAKHRDWVQRRHDDRIRGTWKYRVLDAMLLAPPLASDTYEEGILRHIKPWKRTRAHNSLARNHAPEPPADPKKAPRVGFRVGSRADLVEQAKLLGTRLPGYVSVFEDEASVGTTADLSRLLKKGSRVRIRDQVFFVSKRRDSVVDVEQITLDRPWTGISMDRQAIYLMPPFVFSEAVAHGVVRVARNSRPGQFYFKKKIDVAERVAGTYEMWASRMPGDWPLAFFLHRQKKKWLKRAAVAQARLKEPPQEVADALAKKKRDQLRAKQQSGRVKRGPSGPAYMRDKNDPLAGTPWEKREDDNGNEFYHNTVTGEVQWDMPEDLKDQTVTAAKNDAKKRLEAMRARRAI